MISEICRVAYFTPTQLDQSPNLFLREPDILTFKDLIELTNGDFAFLQNIDLEELPVDVLPITAKFLNEIRVKHHDALAVNFVKTEGSL